LKQLGWNVTKKRITIGFIIKGICISDYWLSKVNNLNKDSTNIEIDNKNISRAFILDNREVEETTINSISENDFNNTYKKT
jgi:predicted regulator of amino acid metabolism with ACT domain